MPISYAIDQPKNLVRTRCTGAVRFPEVLEHFDQLQSDPDRPWSLNVLLDFSGLATSPGAPEARGVAYRIQHMVDFGFGRCAVVAAEEREVAVARLFQELCGPAFTQVRVFPESSDAEAWVTQ